MTAFLKQFDNDQLFASPAGPGRLLLVLPTGTKKDTITLAAAWSDTTLFGNFVYTAADPGISERTAGTFVSAILNRVVSAGPARGFVWLNESLAWQNPPLDGDNAPLLGMDEAGTTVQTGLVAPILPGVRLTVANGSTLLLGETSVTVRGVVSFDGERAPTAAPPAASAVLSLDGAALGTLAFRIFLSRPSLHDASSWGFQFLYPVTGGPQPAAYQWLPLAARTPPDALGFEATIDPSNPANRANDGDSIRSVLAFTGRNADGSATTLVSQYRTGRGTGVTFVPVVGAEEPHPAALVFNGGVPTSDTDQELQLAPMGDFVLTTADEPQSADLLCGLHGTEVITFRPRRDAWPGDRIRFTPYQPAYAPRYPFQQVSPVAAPVDTAAPLLDATYTTSWATVVSGDPATPVPYVAQPKGAALYGWDNPIWNQGTQLMGWKDPANLLPDGVSVPLAPYAGLPQTTHGQFGRWFSPSDTADFERQIIGPTRRRLIGADNGRASRRQADGGPYTTTTPSGQLATVEDGRWTRILLGQTLNPALALCFCNPTLALQQAFQTGQLFLVVANADQIGTAGSGDGTCSGIAPTFLNTVEIGGWRLAAGVGTRNRYGDYRNVLIVKGRKGKLFDAADIAGSLVSNPERWTQKEVFSSPAGPGPNAASSAVSAELVVLSQWLQDYFDAAWRSGGDDLARFNAIAADENWTGVLVLRMDISKVPDDLAGITAGITDMDRFNAHHLGIEISPMTSERGAGGVPPGPRLDGASSMFGLIDYVDPAFVPPDVGKPAQPVAPAGDPEYEFRLLQLKVLFSNTAVRTFTSYAQLTTTTWFGMPVDHMGASGNPYAAIVLHGSLQTNNGRPVYSLSSTTDTTFYFTNDVVNKVEITDAVMSTRSTGTQQGGKVSSWFGLSGFVDFKVVQGTATEGKTPVTFDFDVFSFGSDPTVQGEQLRRGLAFSNLGIAMGFPPDDPAAAQFTFDASEIRFDLSTSTPRPGSLFQQYALDLQGLVSGGAGTPPSKSGYAPAVTDARLTGVDGGPWWGIDYQLTMGTPGNLAGKTGLVSHLVTAWAPEPSGTAGAYRAAIGLRLPGTGGGAKLISLQTVLKLSLGQIWLKYDRDKNGFLLLFTEIGLKLLGLLTIPPGSSLFYLYGNPAAGSSSGLGWYAMYRKKGSGA
ncbi:hypothetical protein [Nonomuraea sediminis]|uniref:hypothetical protein n=1 Tax=Nonomuraea sediminis TaxID=2835864 RepID=UPI001BDC7EA5|nr:hypothetical protein [Nonomuraea sediminis]